MYANLRVKLPDGSIVSAWEIAVTPDEVVLQLDANDGESNYAEPNGEQRVPRAAGKLEIAADF